MASVVLIDRQLCTMPATEDPMLRHGAVRAMYSTESGLRTRHATAQSARQRRRHVISFIADLERRADRSNGDQATDTEQNVAAAQSRQPTAPRTLQESNSRETTPRSDEMGGARSMVSAEEHLDNPLVPGNSPSYTADALGRSVFMGTTSNWSFGRRILSMAHAQVYGAPLPVANLLFEGSTYDLGWDGLRTTVEPNAVLLPTSDHAQFLINAVKFHCGQLYHLFDERSFMDRFAEFHQSGGDTSKCNTLWYIHYLLILAFGKAFVAHSSKGQRLHGLDLFLQAMKMLPVTMYLCADPLQSIEVLCCVALYLQCLDSRSAAYNFIGQAMRIAVEQGMHLEGHGDNLSHDVAERCREIWWTTFILDRQMSSLLGVPLALSDQDVTARLPQFGGSTRRAAAMGTHVEIAKATATIIKTIYRRDQPPNTSRLLDRMKEALKILAETQNSREGSLPLDVDNSTGGLSRLSACLHIFHSQCILLATRPLLFRLWQKRLSLSAPFRVSSHGGVRRLVRVCTSTAYHMLTILETLQSQSLLEIFLPYDLDAAFSSAIVLSLVAAIDPSLLQNKAEWQKRAHRILDEMCSRGNLIARHHQSELGQLEQCLGRLCVAPADQAPGNERMGEGNDSSMRTTSQFVTPTTFPQMHQDQITPHQIGDWESENSLTGEQLMNLANSLDFEQLDWTGAELFDL